MLSKYGMTPLEIAMENAPPGTTYKKHNRDGVHRWSEHYGSRIGGAVEDLDLPGVVQNGVLAAFWALVAREQDYEITYPDGSKRILEGVTPSSTFLAQGSILAPAFARMGKARVVKEVAPKIGAHSKILQICNRNVQKTFSKHGSDFGLSGNWNPRRAAEVRGAINQHINGPGTRAITGKYRGQDVIHHVDPNTGLNVISDANGNFIGGWKLGSEQLEGVLTTGRLF